MKLIAIGVAAGALLLSACTSSTAARGGSATVQNATVGCALGVTGARATMQRQGNAVALEMSCQASCQAELRMRARHSAQLHGPDAHRGMGHAGAHAHGTGGGHGLQAMQLPPVRAVAEDTGEGARITMEPVDAADLEALAQKVEAGAARMNAEACANDEAASL